jgi:alpha-tubulin suppressor-like RCC1 family protein
LTIVEDQKHFFSSSFVQALNDKFVSQIVCGGNHTLLLLDDGAVWAFGSNEFGQVGLKIDSDTSTNAIELPTPVQALKGTSVKQIACGVNHSAALTTGGGVYTWGIGQYGQLGLGENKANNLDVPTKVPSLPIIKKIYSGPNQIFAVEYTNGKSQTWNFIVIDFHDLSFILV